MLRQLWLLQAIYTCQENVVAVLEQRAAGKPVQERNDGKLQTWQDKRAPRLS